MFVTPIISKHSPTVDTMHPAQTPTLVRQVIKRLLMIRTTYISIDNLSKTVYFAPDKTSYPQMILTIPIRELY